MNNILKPFEQFVQENLIGTQSYSILNDFLTFKLELKSEDITIELVERLKEFLLDRVSPNSARTYVAYFRQVVYKASQSGYELGTTYENVKRYSQIQSEASENVYLNRVEVDLVSKYEPISKPEMFAKSAFLLSCYTGARLSDYPLITQANINGDEIVFTAHKTKRSSRLPLHPSVPSLIKALQEFNYAIPSATAIVGTNMKKICEKVGINEVITLYRRGKRNTLPKFAYVGSHTARRSFATNLYLDGWDINSIAKQMGHATTQQTERYIVSSYADEITGDKDFFGHNPKKDLSNMKEQLLGLGLSDVDVAEMILKIEKKI